MHDNIQLFKNKEFGTIRVIEIDGVPWFVGKDVTDALQYGNPRQALKSNVDEEDKGVHSVDTLGGTQKLTVINESGLYSLIMSSRLPSAKQFKRWVTSEVLPSLRKHGAYVVDEILDAAEQSQEFAFELLRKLQAERGKTAALQNKVERLAPKAMYCDLILQSKNTVPVSLIAKDYGVSAAAFNKLLHDMRIQYKCAGTWLLYNTYAGKEYVKTRTYMVNETISATHTYWTQKGRLFLYETLKQYDIIPLMEYDIPSFWEESV